MTTPLSLLCQLCGLSHREAAEYLGVSHDTVKAWSSGRNPTPKRALNQLADLSGKIDASANDTFNFLKERDWPFNVALALEGTEDAVTAIGWPCIGVHRATVARIYALCIRDGMTVI